MRAGREVAMLTDLGTLSYLTSSALSLDVVDFSFSWDDLLLPQDPSSLDISLCSLPFTLSNKV